MKKGKMWDQDFAFKILVEMDENSVRASLIGEVATPLIPSFGKSGQINFIEETAHGNMNLTTIMVTGEAIHSRHNLFNSTESIFSQWYGKFLP